MPSKVVKKRGGYRASARREVNAITHRLGDSDKPSRRELVESLEKLTNYHSKLQELNDLVLEELEDDDDVDREIQDAMDFEDWIVAALATIKAEIEEVTQTSKTSGERDTKDEKNPARTKLPQIEIESFDGDHTRWQEFEDSFTSTIENHRPELADIDKFKYLKRYLTGEALQLAEGYLLTAANYKQVWAALKERYGNPEFAIFSHITAMIEMPASTHDQNELQELYDKFEKHIRCLAALGLDEQSFGRFCVPILLTKLPTFVKMELHRKNEGKPWTLPNLREYLKNELRVRDMSQRQFGDQGEAPSWSKPDSTNKKRPTHGKPTAAMLPSGGKPSPVRKTQGTTGAHGRTPCRFCNKPHHRSMDCWTYRTVDERKGQLGPDVCFNCLTTGHRRTACVSKKTCWHCKAPGHHTSLCTKAYPAGRGRGKVSRREGTSSGYSARLDPSATPFTPGTQSSVCAVVEDTNSGGKRFTNLQTALVTIAAPRATKPALKCHMLLDTAGFRSYITTKAANYIRAVPVGGEDVALGVFEATRRKHRKYDLVVFDVLGKDGSRITVRANVTDHITFPIDKQPLCTATNPILRTVDLAEPLVTEPTAVKIDVLLGDDHYYDGIRDGIIRCNDKLVLVNSVFGYLTAGYKQLKATDQPGQDESRFSPTLLFTHCDQPNVDLDRFWRLEDVGITTEDAPSADDEAALQQFVTNTVYHDGRYHVKFLWKDPSCTIPSNLPLAKGRLRSNLKNLRSRPEVLQKYTDTLTQQEELGIIERVPIGATEHVRVHYIPHHCIVKPDRTTTKLRIVYDGSAKSCRENQSLNDMMHRGPVILADICGVLMRFRTQPFVVTSDIEKAFLQVAIQESDRDITRFLWVHDPRQPPEGNNLMAYRFCRVPFGLICSPFLLAATVRLHLSKFQSPVARTIDRNVYVDNVVCGVDSSAGAQQFYVEAKAIFKAAGMNLREWHTNCPETAKQIPKEDKGSGTETKVLGIKWNTVTDVISCVRKVDSDDTDMWSKRRVLASLATLFDPCGFFAPVTATSKILMQDLWKQRVDWDSPLPQDLLKRWSTCHQELNKVPGEGLQRCAVKGADDASANFELHTFTDASERAYAAVVYLRVVKAGGNASCNLIFAKAKVSPVKPMTVPQLELMGVVIGCRITQFVSKELDLTISRKILWTDSQCSLHWVLNEKVTTPFVRNRVKEIKGHQQEQKLNLRFVPGKQNPADIATRGATVLQVKDSQWFQGPEWLLCDETQWPTIPDDFVGKQFAEPTVPVLAVNAIPRLVDESQLEFITQLASQYSSFAKLKRVLAWVQRFANNCRTTSQNRLIAATPSAEELQRAQLLIVQTTQMAIPDETTVEGRTMKKNLSLFEHNGILRCQGRQQNADLPFEAKHPALLPKNHPVTKAIIREVHEQSHHAGVNLTLGMIKRMFHIPSGRSQVKGELRNCKLCRKLKAACYKAQPFPPLPACRATGTEVFGTTGLDYLGPLFVRTPEGERKVWVCLFTCALVRAIHLELVVDLTAEQFLLALRRFAALYGYPNLIISDNAKQFKSAEKVLMMGWKSVVNSNAVQAHSAKCGVRWKYLTERAPWMGGFYERLVAEVKKCLRAALDRSKVSITELHTVLYEIAATLNARPITYLSTGVEEIHLTPANFLLKGQPASNIALDTPVEDVDYCQSTADVLAMKWKRTLAILGRFWDMWHMLYLSDLRNYPANHKQRGASTQLPEEGTVVIIREPDTPRGMWKMGKIIQVHVSNDGVARAACVRLPNGRTVNRPLKCLSPLEVSGLPEDTRGTHAPEDTPATALRPRRTAAANAKEAIRRLAAEEADSE